jgi:CheY-like chemotaxis protein
MKKRILVVDDEPDFTSLLKLSLESHGYYDVREENDAERARAAAREFGPDLVVLDIMMPAMEGNEVAAALKADPVTRDVPVIFLTALVSRDDAPQGTCSSGGHTFLPKDIRVEKLIRCIEDKLHQHQGAAAH